MAKRLKVGMVRNGKEIIAELGSKWIDNQYRREFTWRCLACAHEYDCCYSTVLCPGCKDGIISDSAIATIPMWEMPSILKETPLIKWTDASKELPKEDGQYIVGTVNNKGKDIIGCALWFKDHWQTKSNSHKHLEIENWFHIRELDTHVEALHIPKNHKMTAEEIKSILIDEFKSQNELLMVGVFNNGEFALWPDNPNVLEISFTKNHAFFKDIILNSNVSYEDMLKKIVSPELKTNLIFGD